MNNEQKYFDDLALKSTWKIGSQHFYIFTIHFKLIRVVRSFQSRNNKNTETIQ